ncbi:hypothetical protein NC651_007215 [Populus alba x Populus x berolinensis]|nr:hypothetical protein NC651_007215 [Populus alba x Populus x berolinensis]
MLNSPKHTNAFWNPLKYPEPVPGYFKVLDRCEKPLATKFPSCSNATMAAIFKKKHIPKKCCPEVTKFSKFCYHALGLFVATTPDFILTVPDFFERTQKAVVHTNTLKHLMSGEDCKVKLATFKTGFGNMHFCICVCNLQREIWQTNWPRLNLALCNHITIYSCEYLTQPGRAFFVRLF